MKVVSLILYDRSCFGMRIRQCVLDGVVKSHQNFTMSNGVRRGGTMLPFLFNV